MATGLNKLIDHLHRTLAPAGGGPTDGQLLSRFIAARDEASFATLVRRHGPMVWRVCLRVLGHAQDAEDAFQATFLVLACRAAAVLKRESVGSFLHGVAYRTALDARAVRARRRTREKQGEAMPHPAVPPAEPQDWRPWLDRELNRLPEKYRAAVILCDLEGRSRKEAARQLKVPEGTLSSRLATARRLLARRLARYGLALAGGALASALSVEASAAVPAALTALTIKTAALAAAGEGMAVSASVAALMKGAMQTMFIAKLKLAIGAMMVLVALSASGLVYRAAGQSAAAPKKPPSEVETLRRENELLKLNLEVVLEKVRAQEGELRTLRADARGKSTDGTARVEGTKVLSLPITISDVDIEVVDNIPLRHAEWKKRFDRIAPPEVLKHMEESIKAMKQAPDLASFQRAMEDLNKLLAKLHELNLSKQPSKPAQK